MIQSLNDFNALASSVLERVHHGLFQPYTFQMRLAKFALQNISEGGAMGENVANLEPGAKVHVRFEGGILVPAVLKWAEDGVIGLAFITPVMLDRTN